MPTPSERAATQLANILEATGSTVPAFTRAVRKAKLEKHGQIVAFFKSDYGLTHGNANLLAHVVREELAGGAPEDAELLDQQYAGKKAALRPVYERLQAAAAALGDDVETVVQKTGVAFRCRKNFLVVKPASSKRVELGLNLPSTPASDRVRETKGMCTHRVDVHAAGDVDRQLIGWIRKAYAAAAKKGA